jgi:parvulin-like peptidyl-prolyl isomerase
MEVDMLVRHTVQRTSTVLAILGFCAVQAYGQGAATAEKPAAHVNGEAIGMAEVRAALEARPSPVPLTAAQQRELRQAALDMLIDDMLMRQFLRKNALPAQPAEVDKEIGELKEALKKKTKTLEQFLREGKQTEEQFRRDVTARIQWKHYLAARYSEADAKSYYEANKLLFDKVLVRASHILVKVGPTAPAAEKQTARAKLETIRQEISAGKIDFGEAAKKYSDCPSKDKGGDIGQFPYKFVVVEPFAKAAFAMKKGDVSDIVVTDFGLHLIKVTDRTPGEATTYDSVKDSVRDVMAQDMELYQSILAQQRKAAKIEVHLQ